MATAGPRATSARSGSPGRGEPRSSWPSSPAASVGDAQKRARIKSYRAGYLAEDRRKLERELANGELLGDRVDERARARHRHRLARRGRADRLPGHARVHVAAGRAGGAARRKDSLAMLVAQDDPLDQYLVHHPEDLFDKPAEAAVIDPTNPYVLEPHLACAARELPLTEDDLRVLRGRADVGGGRAMVDREELVQRRDTWNDRGGSRRTARSTSAPEPGTSLDRHRRDRRAAGHGRRASRVRLAPPRRRVPAPGRAVLVTSSTW